MKIETTLSLLLIIVLVFGCSVLYTIIRDNQTPVIVIDLEFFKFARHYHGDVTIKFDETESFYFMRDGIACPVFTEDCLKAYSKED